MREMICDRAQPELIDQLGGRARTAARRTGQARGHEHVLGSAQLLDQLELLEHEPDMAQPDPGQRPGAAAGDLLPGQRDLAGVERVEPASPRGAAPSFSRG
jgi:hypothetical protein